MVIRDVGFDTRRDDGYDDLSGSPVALVERLDRVECERVVLVQNGELGKVVVERNVAVAVADREGQVEGGVEAVAREVVVVDVDILDGEADVFRADDEPCNEDAQAQEDDQEEQRDDGTLEKPYQAAARWGRLLGLRAGGVGHLIVVWWPVKDLDG